MKYRYHVKSRDNNEGFPDWNNAGEWNNIDHAKSDWDDNFDVIVRDLLTNEIHVRENGEWKMMNDAQLDFWLYGIDR